MIRLDDLSLFVRAAALGSFSQAAREVNLLPGQVSAAIGRLERPGRAVSLHRLERGLDFFGKS